MSTRCLVGYRDKDTVHYIYCHFDGYVEKPGVGYTLFNHYKDLNKIKDKYKYLPSQAFGKPIKK